MASIRKRIASTGEISYQIRAFVKKDENGHPISITKTYKPMPGMSEKKAYKEATKIGLELDRKVKASNMLEAKTLLSDYADYWLDMKKTQALQPTTLKSYENILKNIKTCLGHISLGELTQKHVRDFYTMLQTTNTQYGTPYSLKTIQNHHRILRDMLGDAVREGILEKNIVSREYFIAPKVEKLKPVYLDLDQAQEFMGLLAQEQDIKIKACLSLFLYTGMREGELCGLEWKDIDFENNTILIERCSAYVPGQGIITKPPKNETSKRLIQMPLAMKNILIQYHNWYEERKAICGTDWVNSNRLFVQYDGKPIYPRTTAEWLKQFLKKNKLPKITPHKLRHTYATLQIANGIDITTVAGILGHSTPTTTLNIYSHQVKQAQDKAVDSIDKMLTPKIVNIHTAENKESYINNLNRKGERYGKQTRNLA